MPTYVYKREDGSTFEIEQRITEDALETCPTTGQTVIRVISGGTGLIFKGSGFYQTDYVRDKDGKKSSSGESSSSSTDTDSKPATKEKSSTETTPTKPAGDSNDG